MNPLLKEEGEIALLINDPRLKEIDNLEPWQLESMLLEVELNSSQGANGGGLMKIDSIVKEWLHNLSVEQWAKIRRQNSLHGVKIPEKWVQMWRFVLKTPTLRDPEWGFNHNRKVGSNTHIWNLWAADCIETYTDEIDKELLYLNDAGLTHLEIGVRLYTKYGQRFWKPRKVNSKTTPAQVVSYYLYQKIPRKIAKGELLDICKKTLKRAA